jgi:hypothetical protein
VRQHKGYPSVLRKAYTFTVKQFIRNVRASKTIADERAVVQKESAAIRASFREESGDHNVRLVKETIYSTHELTGNDNAGETTLQNYSTSSRWGKGHISDK